jgi:hypothetical protein
MHNCDTITGRGSAERTLASFSDDQFKGFGVSQEALPILESQKQPGNPCTNIAMTQECNK